MKKAVLWAALAAACSQLVAVGAAAQATKLKFAVFTPDKEQTFVTVIVLGLDPLAAAWVGYVAAFHGSDLHADQAFEAADRGGRHADNRTAMLVAGFRGVDVGARAWCGGQPGTVGAPFDLAQILGAGDDFLSIAGLALGVPRAEIYSMTGDSLKKAADLGKAANPRLMSVVTGRKKGGELAREIEKDLAFLKPEQRKRLEAWVGQHVSHVRAAFALMRE